MSSYTAKDLNFDSIPLIKSVLDELKVSNLKNNTSEFEKKIKSYIRNEIVIKEKYYEPENQNLHMVNFYWGHDHDFGSFNVSGMMGTRHIWMLSRFFDHFGVSPLSIRGGRILDIGCWTGGVSLILNKLGAKVIAIDEIQKYTSALSYLVNSFELSSLDSQCLSVYDLGKVNFIEEFDFVFCLGVIYHLSDPIIALRRIYNSLKPRGIICLESMSIDNESSICEYEGPSRIRGNFGWNWFVPSPKTIFQLLEDTGFEDIRVGNGLTNLSVTTAEDPMGANRCFAVARKKENHIICQAGLSIDID